MIARKLSQAPYQKSLSGNTLLARRKNDTAMELVKTFIIVLKVVLEVGVLVWVIGQAIAYYANDADQRP